MMDIFEQFYYGELNPCRDLAADDGKTRGILNKIEDERDNWLKNLLSEENFKRFKKLEDEYNFLTRYKMQQGYTEGFKFAVMLMIEILY